MSLFQQLYFPTNVIWEQFFLSGNSAFSFPLIQLHLLILSHILGTGLDSGEKNQTYLLPRGIQCQLGIQTLTCSCNKELVMKGEIQGALGRNSNVGPRDAAKFPEGNLLYE